MKELSYFIIFVIILNIYFLKRWDWTRKIIKCISRSGVGSYKGSLEWKVRFSKEAKLSNKDWNFLSLNIKAESDCILHVARKYQWIVTIVSYSHWHDGVYPDIADDDDHQGQEEDLRSDQGVIHTVPGVRGHPQQRQLCDAGPILESDVPLLR